MRRCVSGRLQARAAVTALLVVLFPLLGTGVAAAHVTVVSPDSLHGPETIEQGGYSNVTFRVPNEEQHANTVEVRVEFPADTPVATAAVEPVRGWDADIETQTFDEPVEMGDASVTEAVETITWTADDEGTAPGRFQRFTVSLGGVPTNTDELRLPTVQTYDDGTVVEWTESSEGDSAEPEHPAPALRLVEHGTAETVTDDAASEDPAEAATTTPDGPDTLARWLGGLALVITVVGGSAALVYRNRRGGSV